MIFYNSLLAKWFLGKGKKHYFMLGWFFFTRYKYLEVWEDMELPILSGMNSEFHIWKSGKIWNSEFMPDSIGNVFL